MLYLELLISFHVTNVFLFWHKGWHQLFMIYNLSNIFNWDWQKNVLFHQCSRLSALRTTDDVENTDTTVRRPCWAKFRAASFSVVTGLIPVDATRLIRVYTGWRVVGHDGVQCNNCNMVRCGHIGPGTGHGHQYCRWNLWCPARPSKTFLSIDLWMNRLFLPARAFWS